MFALGFILIKQLILYLNVGAYSNFKRHTNVFKSYTKTVYVWSYSYQRDDTFKNLLRYISS